MSIKFKEITFTTYDFSKNDYTADDGEIELCSTAIPMADGTLTQTLAAEAIAEIQHGELLAIHNSRYIIYNDGALYWTPAVADGGTIEVEDLHLIEATSKPKGIALFHDMIVTNSDDGLKYYLCIADGYVALPQLPRLPVIEFGMQKAGQLVASSTVEIPVDLLPMPSGTPGSGAYTPHQFVGTNHSSKATLNEHVNTLYDEAVSTQAHSRGYFTSPVMLRYALRTIHDEYIAVSPPMLLLPTVLPPCIEANVVDSDDKEATLRLNLTSCNYHQLRYRVLDTLPRQWSTVIQAVDIFVSTQLPTHITEGDGQLCTYSDIVKNVADGSVNRGRNHTSTTSLVFEGCYSDGNDVYTDHYLSDSDLRKAAWYLQPNQSLSHQIVSEHKFYRIASLPFESITTMSRMSTFEIESTQPADISSHRLLPENIESISIRPDVVFAFNNSLVAGGGKKRLPEPCNPLCSCAFTGDASAQPDDEIEIVVLSRHNGNVCQTSMRYASAASMLTYNFPRYIYHPDSNAYMMYLKQGGSVYRLPLVRHVHLDGTYWYGGLDASHAPAPVPSHIFPSSVGDNPWIDCKNIVYISDSKSRRCFSFNRSADMAGNIKAFATAVRPADQGLFGRYPLYAFTDAGIWLLDINNDAVDNNNVFKNVRFISSLTVESDRCVSPYCQRVIVSTADSLYALSGTNIKRLVDMLQRRYSFDANCYPMLQQMPGWQQHTAISDRLMPYVYGLDRFEAVINYGGDATMLWHDANQHLSSLSYQITSVPASNAAESIVCIGNKVCILGLAHEAPSAVSLLTRPFKLTHEYTTKRVRTVTVWGKLRQPICTAPGHQRHQMHVAVYAATHIGHWHLLASACGHRVEIASNTPVRFLCIAVTATLQPGEYLSGAQIEYE